MKPRKPLKQEAPTVTLDVSELRKSVTFVDGEPDPKIDYSFLLRGADGPISEKDRATLDQYAQQLCAVAYLILVAKQEVDLQKPQIDTVVVGPEPAQA